MNSIIELESADLTDECIDTIYEIECSCFEQPWSRADIETCVGNGYHTFLIKDDDDKNVVGFAIFTVVSDIAELQDIAILSNTRQKGLGYKLLSSSMDILRNTQGSKIFYLEVRVSNEPAVNLYKKLGYKIDHIRKGYYPTSQSNVREDAYLMSKNETETDE